MENKLEDEVKTRKLLSEQPGKRRGRGEVKARSQIPGPSQVTASFRMLPCSLRSWKTDFNMTIYLIFTCSSVLPIHQFPP